MSDERDLERLKAALERATPAPDPARQAGATARAMAEFDRVQGSADAARRMSGRSDGGAGFWTGVRAMLSPLANSRAVLAGGASLAALGLAMIVILPQAPMPGGPPVPVAAPEPAPRPAAAPAEMDAEVTADAAAAPGVAREEAVTVLRSGDGLTGMAEPGAMEAPAAEAAATLGSTAAAPAAPGAFARSSVIVPEGGAVAPFGGAMDMVALPPEADAEAFSSAGANPLRVTAESPVSTFSVDVDTASYAVVRSSLNRGMLPPPEAVRIEEMVNYFPYAWPAPEPGEGPFRATVSLMPTPWNPDTRLVTLALKGRMPAVEDRPPLNLVFLLDTSGSMQGPDRLPLLKQSLRLMLPELRPEDQVAIVAYAGSAGEVLAPTPASDRAAILAALDRLEAGGSTAGGEGLGLAYDVAARMAAEGEVSRVILATDGDFNVGLSDPAELERFIARQREAGTYLSVLGFGRGNLDDAVMQALAQNGNGTAAYIDTLNEARKVLVDELSGALFPIADDVKIQVEWNPATVAEYRLIGYETRQLAREDFANDRVDAGEIGAGHSVTALYEITPVGSPARMTEPLRYGAAEPAQGSAEEYGFLRLRWKAPGAEASVLAETPILRDAPEAGEDARFAAAVAGFGQLLTGGRHLGDWSWDEAIALAASARGEDPFGYRAEAVGLMRLAQSLSR